MKNKLNSVMVNDQAKALAFYTEKLGFVKKEDIPMGEFRWLTVVSPDGPDDLELVLEPNAHAAAKVFQKAIYDDGIPAAAFVSSDLKAEHALLVEKGVQFTKPPTDAGGTMIATFDDTCGNLIQLYQVG